VIYHDLGKWHNHGELESMTELRMEYEALNAAIKASSANIEALHVQLRLLPGQLRDAQMRHDQMLKRNAALKTTLKRDHELV